MAEQFDVSAEKRKILEENAKRKAVLRNEFLKKKFDPFQHASGEGGTVFDTAIYRYNALRATGYEFFRPNRGSVRFGVLYIVLPIVGTWWWMRTVRAEVEQSYRNGEVAYKDRRLRFL